MSRIVLVCLLVGACSLPCDRTIEGTLIESPTLAARGDSGYLVSWWLRGEREGTWARSADTSGNWSEPRQLASRKLVELVGSGERYLAADDAGTTTVFDTMGNVIAEVVGTETLKAAIPISGGWLALYTDARPPALNTGALYVSRVMFDGQRTPLEIVASNASLDLATTIELDGTAWVIFGLGTDVKAVRYDADRTRIDVEPILLAQYSTLTGAVSAGTKALLGLRATSSALYFLSPDGSLDPLLSSQDTAASEVYAGIPDSGFLGRDFRRAFRWYDLNGAPSVALATGDGNDSHAVVGAPGNAVVVLTGSDGAHEQAETNSWLTAAIVPFGQATYLAEFREAHRHYDNGSCL